MSSAVAAMQPFVCRSCGRALGLTDGKALVRPGGEATERTTVLRCVCRRERVWRPVVWEGR